MSSELDPLHPSRQVVLLQVLTDKRRAQPGREVLRLGVVRNDGGRRQLGVQLIGLSLREADALGLAQLLQDPLVSITSPSGLKLSLPASP